MRVEPEDVSVALDGTVKRPRVPRVGVLLATYNGLPYIEAQLNSILAQEGVDTKIFISDDQSTDGTWEYVSSRAQSHPEIWLHPRGRRLGSAGKNFFRLIAESSLSNLDYVAFSDQDDIWNQDKLLNAVSEISRGGFAGYSSSTIAVYPDGSVRLVPNDAPPAPADFFFQGAGQGCTFVLPVTDFSRVRDFVAVNRAALEGFDFHDWFVYAYIRYTGGHWVFDPSPSMQYRQHAENELGANVGVNGAIRRFRKIRALWYRSQVLTISSLLAAVPSQHSPNAADVNRLLSARLRLMDRLRLLFLAGPRVRRRWSEAALVWAMMVIGLL